MTNEEKFNLLGDKIAACQRCKELVEGRIKTVLGDGNPSSKIVLLGEAPGANEAKQGVAFVGRAGQLLDNILNACGLDRTKVYILNVLKCRPPSNRAPTPEEAANCRPFLDLQLDVIKPDYIVCLGASAAHHLLNEETPISQMRGKWFDYKGIKAICTFHPAYLLRQPAKKKDVWDDFQLLVKKLSPQNDG